MFNSKLRKEAIDMYNLAVKRYEKSAQKLDKNATHLYQEREKAISLVKIVEQRINEIANTPKEFKVTLKKIDVALENFESKQQKIKSAEIEAKTAAGGSGAGATLSALGVAVATMGPTAAMGFATTFGVASTGTAISTLSGAAATNAALAWLGGGALAVGGGGINAGAALLALAGPVGWTIAGVMLATSVGAGVYANHKNKETADELIKERQNIEILIRKLNSMNAEVNALIDATLTQVTGVRDAKNSLVGTDYNAFSDDQKIQAGFLVNSTLTLAMLINKELELYA